MGDIEQSTRRGGFKRSLAIVDESRSDSTRNAALAAHFPGQFGNRRIRFQSGRKHVWRFRATRVHGRRRDWAVLTTRIPAGLLVFTMQAISTVLGTREANATNTGSRAESVVFADAPFHVTARPRSKTLRKGLPGPVTPCRDPISDPGYVQIQAIPFATYSQADEMPGDENEPNGTGNDRLRSPSGTDIAQTGYPALIAGSRTAASMGASMGASTDGGRKRRAARQTVDDVIPRRDLLLRHAAAARSPLAAEIQTTRDHVRLE